MKSFKQILFGFLFLFIFFSLKVSIVSAEQASDFIDKVEIKVQGGGASGETLTPWQFSDATTIYKDSSESYVDPLGDGTYKTIGIKDNTVGLITVVTFNQNKLKAIGGWSDITGIWIHKSCGGTVSGDQYILPNSLHKEAMSKSTFESQGYKVEFPADPDCKLDLFSQRDSLSIRFWLQKTPFSIKNLYAPGDQIEFDWANYTFNLQDKPLADTCDLNVYNSSNTEITSADNETDIKIVGSGIDDGKKGYKLYLDNEVLKQFGLDCHSGAGGGANCIYKAEPNFEYPLGKKTVGNYTIYVKQNQTDNVLCQMSLPIYQKGATPTPFSSVTGIQTNSSITLDVATTIPLCDSIPEDADCGNGQQCKTKCMACEKTEGIWTGIGCMPTDFAGLISSLFTTFAGILGALIFFCVASNGIKVMVSRGNAESMKKAQQAITACIVGFLVLATSVLFLKIVGVNILQLPGWS